MLPEREVVPDQVHLRLGQLVRVGQHLGHHVHEGLGDTEFVGRRGDAVLCLALDVIVQQLGSTLGDFGVGLGDFLGIRQLGLGLLLGGGHSSLLVGSEVSGDAVLVDAL